MSRCLNFTITLQVLAVVFTNIRAWDLGVVTQTQFQFLTNNTIDRTAADELKNMVAATYDPIKKDIYISDSNHKAGSIFRIKTVGDSKYSVVQPVVNKQKHSVQGMVFDHRTSTLYWTTGNGLTIESVQVPDDESKLPLDGSPLITFVEEIPMGIAIDNCRGYLYWTNGNHRNASIERSRLDGKNREVVIRGQLFMPQAIAIDVERNLLYWSDERESIYYSIERQNLTDGSRNTLIRGMHHQPFAIALGEHVIYWTDWTNNALFSLPKDSFQYSVQPTLVSKYESINAPMGLITPVGNTTFVNGTYCVMHRVQDVDEKKESVAVDDVPVTAVPESYEVLRDICKNGGVLHSNGTCACAAGYDGKKCETATCHEYCVDGTCSLSEDGRPTCKCSTGSYGDRCEKRSCLARCLNGGRCVAALNDNGDVDGRCECPAGFTGDVCQHRTPWLTEMCPVYCKHTNPQSSAMATRQHKECGCDEYNNNRQYEYADMASLHPDMSSCKLSKSVMAVIAILVVFVAALSTITLVLFRRVRALGRRPRIKKRIVVNKSITPLTCRPPEQNQQCEITIENCCNMNICETPCFEPDFRSPKLQNLMSSKSKKEDKASLLSNTDMSSEDEKSSY